MSAESHQAAAGGAVPATHVTRSHTIEIPLPLAETMPLFTPLGETWWLPGWAPTFIHPSTGETCEGGVFTTTAADDPGPTWWTVALWQPQEGRARYARVTPGSRSALVDVQARAIGSQMTAVTVSYAVTVLSDHGEAWLARFTPEAFRADLERWAMFIREYVSRRSHEDRAVTTGDTKDAEVERSSQNAVERSSGLSDSHVPWIRQC